MTSVVLADPAKEVSGDHFDTLFAPAKISCQASAQSFGCRSDGGITLGWGSSASLSHSYFASNPDKWMSISRFAQGSATLSQYVDWMPLSSGLDSNQHLDSKVRDHLKAEYVKLLAMHSPTFDDFSGFASELEAAKAVTGDDSEFQKVFQQLARTGSAVTGVGYRPKYAAFHVLLHEIGHTFGMMHADNPNADSVTGQSSTTSLDPVSHQFKTPISTMAYADQYVYLTEDDRLGISSGAKATSAEVLRHK